MPSYSAKRALLGNIIDYAGTFPPAALPLADALKEAASFRSKGKHPWLLSKVALPLEDIKKLGAKVLADSGSDGTPWLYTALGSPTATAADALATLEWDFRELRRCNERGFNSSLRQWILAYETKLPADILAGGGSALEDYLEKFAALTHFSLDLFLELPVDAEWQSVISAAAQSMVNWRESFAEVGEWSPGIKVRTGGKVVPSPDDLAHAVVVSTTHKLRFKATQGLHHAVTRDGSYGFVNLFGALALAQALGEEKFGKNAVVACLKESRRENFEFTDRVFRWDKYELDVESIEAARRRHAASFGSCSLDEPDHALAEDFGGDR